MQEIPTRHVPSLARTYPLLFQHCVCIHLSAVLTFTVSQGCGRSIRSSSNEFKVVRGEDVGSTLERVPCTLCRASHSSSFLPFQRQAADNSWSSSGLSRGRLITLKQELDSVEPWPVATRRTYMHTCIRTFNPHTTYQTIMFILFVFGNTEHP